MGYAKNRHVLLKTLLILESIIFVNSQGNSCYDGTGQPKTCIPGPENLVRGRTVHVTPGMTCGSPGSGYCEPGVGSKCLVCNESISTQRHRPEFMTDKEVPPRYWPFRKPTWWQSITWWDAKVQGQLRDGTVKVNLTIALGKSFDITGKFKVTFYASQPKAAVLFKSSDSGKTWEPFRYFADDCSRRFAPQIPDQHNTSDPRKAYCERKPLSYSKGSVFEFEPSYDASSFWNPEVQEYLKATHVQFRLEYPWTDGNEQTGGEGFLNRYYYDVADLRVDGRCHCNGHAPFCIDDTLGLRCDCQHNTEGTDCERCKPLYNNKAWKPAQSANQPNACERCLCNNHASSCQYNATLGYGICQNCSNNTTGSRCDSCKDKFYRNTSAAINESSACLPCNCFVLGILNNGSCVQNSAGNTTAGQCACKPNVYGRTCNSCRDGYYGLGVSPLGECKECNCSAFGASNGTIACHQNSGQCRCKETVTGKTCDRCKTGFFNFPRETGKECQECSCTIGGSTYDICERSNGTCLCRRGIVGKRCQSPAAGYFFPTFDHLKFEAEEQMGTYATVVANGPGISGSGFARLFGGKFLSFSFVAQYTSRFYIIVRGRVNIPRPLSLKIEVEFENNTISLPMATFHLNVSSKSNMTTGILQSPYPLLWYKNGTYNVNLTIAEDTKSVNASYDIDSVILMPDIRTTNYFTLANQSLQNFALRCWSSRFYISSDKDSQCRDVAFNTLVELNDGAEACNCTSVGSENGTCKAYGGQCSCKPGVGGRQCDKCLPGYFNYTSFGCTACACDTLGSFNYLCDFNSGQCSCKSNVLGRQCQQCRFGFYGLKNGSGCYDCQCNKNGSLSLQCDELGRCPCKNSTTGQKCDQCKENYYNFTSSGCSYCNCHTGGSKLSQCDEYGNCTCKRDAIGRRCEGCPVGYFGINPHNPYGCQRCFCFGHSGNCSQLADAPKINITWDFAGGTGNWSINSSNGSDTYRSSNSGLVFQLGTETIYLSAPSLFLGFQLYSYTQNLVLRIGGASGGNFSVIMAMQSDPAVGEVRFSRSSSSGQRQLDFLIHESQAESAVSGFKLQSVLATLRKLHLIFSSSFSINVTLKSISLETARQGHFGEQPPSRNVEHCGCHGNYTGNSCELCMSGYTRAIPSSGPFQKCLLCNCSGRSQECDPATGKCRNCREGTEGDHCERCQPGVQGPSCLQCISGYYGFNDTTFPGCRACNCELNNTVHRNRSVCDVITGQCACLRFYAGRRCEKCVENAANVNGTCQGCSDCHGLLEVEVLALRKMLQNLSKILRVIKPLPERSLSQTLKVQLESTKQKVRDLFLKAQQSSDIERKLNEDLKTLNSTLNSLENTLAKVTSSKLEKLKMGAKDVSGNVTRLNDTMASIYSILWGGRYVIDSHVKTYANAPSRTVAQLQLLSSEFQRTENLIRSKWNTTFTDGRHVVLLASQVSNTTDAALANINASNDTVTALQRNISVLMNSISSQVAITSDLMQNLSTAASNISKLLQGAINLSRNLENQTLNSNSVLKLVSANVSEVQFLGRKVRNNTEGTRFLQYQITSLWRSLENASLPFKMAINNSVEVAAKLLAQARQAYVNLTETVQMTKKILLSMQETLSLVQNFNRSMTNAQAAADRALRHVKTVNQSSAETLTIAKSLRLSLADALKLSNKTVNEMQRIRRATEGLSVVLTNLSGRAEQLNFMFEASNYTVSYSKDLRNNVSTKRTEIINKIAPRCNNVTFMSDRAVNTGNRSRKEAQKALRETMDARKGVTDIVSQFSILPSLNTTRLNQLQRSLKEHKQNFTASGVAAMISFLRTRLLVQQNEIRSYRESIRVVTEEIKTLKEVVGSLSAVEGCG